MSFGIDSPAGVERKSRIHVDGFPRFEVHSTGEVRGFPFADGDRLVKVGEAFGVGQTWQNVLASRATNTNYPNSTGKTILVAVSVTSMSVSGHGVYGQIIGIGTVAVGRSGAGGNTGSFILEVPEGSTYSITADSGVLDFWWEYR